MYMIIPGILVLLVILGGCAIRGQILDGDGMERTDEQIAKYQADRDEEAERMDPIAIPGVRIGDRYYTVELDGNSSAEAFLEKLKEGPLTVAMQDYGGFEKVGDLPWPLPANDEEITTEPGDIILYQGNKITIYYGENTWTLTKIGRVSCEEEEELRKALGEGDVTAEFFVEWTE